MNTVELEERLIEFSVNSLFIAEQLPKSIIGKYFTDQLTRSASSPALNYGEVRGAESKKDFIHKLKIVLKELRETKNCLLIINKKHLVDIKKDIIFNQIGECDELISIIVKSINSTRNNVK